MLFTVTTALSFHLTKIRVMNQLEPWKLRPPFPAIFIRAAPVHRHMRSLPSMAPRYTVHPEHIRSLPSILSVLFIQTKLM